MLLNTKNQTQEIKKRPAIPPPKNRRIAKAIQTQSPIDNLGRFIGFTSFIETPLITTKILVIISFSHYTKLS
jgi:hypothetical protein